MSEPHDTKAPNNILNDIELRDLFAASFISGGTILGLSKLYWLGLAKMSYEFADVMIEAREATRKK